MGLSHKQIVEEKLEKFGSLQRVSTTFECEFE